MAEIKIDRDKCKGCMLCVSACPNKLIIQSKNLNKRGVQVVEIKDADKCTGCAMCAIMCPDMCIEVWK